MLTQLIESRLRRAGGEQWGRGDGCLLFCDGGQPSLGGQRGAPPSLTQRRGKSSSGYSGAYLAYVVNLHILSLEVLLEMVISMWSILLEERDETTFGVLQAPMGDVWALWPVACGWGSAGAATLAPRGAAEVTACSCSRCPGMKRSEPREIPLPAPAPCNTSGDWSSPAPPVELELPLSQRWDYLQLWARSCTAVNFPAASRFPMLMQSLPLIGVGFPPGCPTAHPELLSLHLLGSPRSPRQKICT